MKIGLLFASLKIGGGVEKVQSDMSHIFAELGHDSVHILSENLEPKHQCTGKIISLHSPFIKGFGPKKIYKLFSDTIKVIRICRDENIELLIGQGDYFYMISGLAKILGYKGKTIAIVHTTIGIWPKIIQKILQFFLRKHDAIILISEEEKRIFETQYRFPKPKLHYIPNSIDSKNIEILAQESTKTIHFDIFTYINIGRLTHQKGQKQLLEAFDIFWQEHQNSQLLILGDGELSQELHEFANTLASKNHIFFLGNQENPYKFLAKSHCFVLSSHFEGFGMVLLEAMLCKIPIISTNCPSGPTEILQNGKCGMLVNYKNHTIQELADTMTQMYHNKNLAEDLVQKGTQRVQDFSRKNIEKLWKNFLDNI